VACDAFIYLDLWNIDSTLAIHKEKAKLPKNQSQYGVAIPVLLELLSAQDRSLQLLVVEVRSLARFRYLYIDVTFSFCVHRRQLLPSLKREMSLKQSGLDQFFLDPKCHS
jgi:hypothetical protein